MQPETVVWATEEFGHAQLGDARRTARLISIAAKAAESPSGRLSEVFQESADLEGAYRFVESCHVDDRCVGEALYRTTARRAASEELVLVPVDGSNITVPWAAGSESFGPVSASSQGSRGVEVMSAMAVTPTGMPLGLAGQQWWVRHETSDRTGKPKVKKRPLHLKETQHWFRCVSRVESAFAHEAVSTQRWYQLDAGADFGEMLHWIWQTNAYVTVRAAQNRRLLTGDDRVAYLWEEVQASTRLGGFTLDVQQGPRRKARKARIDLRSTPVEMPVRDPSMKIRKVGLTAVLAQEDGTTPAGEEPIEWLLLTNHPVTSCEEARKVVHAYSLRWRIEAFHKTWKTTCGVEKNQMQMPDSLILWAMILAAVAMRIERLTRLARETPLAPATEELTPNEIEAVIVMQRPAGYKRGDIPTIGEAVEWIARQGGYRGKSSGGPPGTVVVGRGLRRIEIAAEVLAQVDPGS